MQRLLVHQRIIRAGEHDDGHLGAGRHRLAQQLQTGAAAQAVIEQAGVVTAGVQLGDALVERGGPIEFVGVRELGTPQQQGQIMIILLPVFHDEDSDGPFLGGGVT